MVTINFLLLFIVMTPVSILLLVKQSANRLLVWAALLIFTVGLSGLQVFFEKQVLPYFESIGASDTSQTVLYIVTMFLNIVIHTVPYYFILVFFMHYADSSKKAIVGLLAIPIILPFVISVVEPTPTLNYTYILSWGIPYMLASIVLFFVGLVKVARKGLEKLQKLQYIGIGMIVLIPEACLLIFQLEGIYYESSTEILIYIPLVCLISLLLGITMYVYNVFSQFQNRSVLTKMQVGTSLMQHAFKNAISKNKLHAKNIQRSLQSKEYAFAESQLQSLLKSNDHLMGMVSRLSYLSRNELNIQIEPTNLSDVLDEVLEQFMDMPVSFDRRYRKEIVLVDRTLISECFTNILSNAIESMSGRGRVDITVERDKKRVKVNFTDKGKGMDKVQLNHMFDPFFSTKHKSGHNFGLGMFYVKRIMNAHRGKVQVTSQPGKGTSVQLIFN